MLLQKPFALVFMLHFPCNRHSCWENCVCLCACTKLLFTEEGLNFLPRWPSCRTGIRECACLYVVRFYESFWLAKKAFVSPQVGLVHSGQRRVSWREHGLLDFRWDWTRSASACTGQTAHTRCETRGKRRPSIHLAVFQSVRQRVN